MAEMPFVVTFTVNLPNTPTSEELETLRTNFSTAIGGREVRAHAHVRHGTDLVFSALKPVNPFTPARWAGLLRDVCSSRNPVQWTIHLGFNW